MHSPGGVGETCRQEGGGASLPKSPRPGETFRQEGWSPPRQCCLTEGAGGGKTWAYALDMTLSQGGLPPGSFLQVVSCQYCVTSGAETSTLATPAACCRHQWDAVCPRRHHQHLFASWTRSPLGSLQVAVSNGTMYALGGITTIGNGNCTDYFSCHPWTATIEVRG